MVNSVFKAIKILELLGDQPNLGVTELANIFSLPKSSVHNILKTLENERLIERNGLNGKYHLGIKLVELGNQAQVNLDIYKLSAPFLYGLNQKFDETVHLTILDNDEVLYIDCIESKKRLRTYSVLGVRAPLYCTAVGKIILAFMDDSKIRRIIKEKGLKQYTAQTISSEKRLFEEIEKIRILGYAIDRMEHEDHIQCIGAPIRNARGEVFASMSISGPAERLTEKKLVEMSKFLIDVTDSISRKFGYSK